jgi:hypothetical protein
VAALKNEAQPLCGDNDSKLFGRPAFAGSFNRWPTSRDKNMVAAAAALFRVVHLTVCSE